MLLLLLEEGAAASAGGGGGDLWLLLALALAVPRGGEWNWMLMMPVWN